MNDTLFVRKRIEKAKKFISRLKDSVVKFIPKENHFIVEGRKFFYDFMFDSNRVIVNTKDEPPKIFEVNIEDDQ